ncbi:MAG: hypothetical protein LAT56_17410, partial [Wenzhouxiangella sp.]|nr:hypothetical protein [Wenzhouxiangella sp.]
GGSGMDKRTELLQYVLRRARERVANPPPEEEGGANLRNLWQATRGRTEIESTQELYTLVERLQEWGCLRLREQPATGGRPRTPSIEIHPALAESVPKSPIRIHAEAPKASFGSFGDEIRGGGHEAKGPPATLTEEDLQYLGDEREGMKQDSPPVEVPGLLEVDG